MKWNRGSPRLFVKLDIGQGVAAHYVVLDISCHIDAKLMHYFPFVPALFMTMSTEEASKDKQNACR